MGNWKYQWWVFLKHMNEPEHKILGHLGNLHLMDWLANYTKYVD